MDSTSHPAATSDNGLRKWFLWALVISLLFHGALFEGFSLKKLEHFDASPEGRLVARAQFKTSRAELDPRVFQDDKQPPAVKPKPVVPQKQIRPPIDKPSAVLPENALITPKVQDIAQHIAPERPTVKPTEQLLPAQSSSAVSSELAQVAKQLRESQPLNPATNATISFPASSDETAGKGNAPSGTEALDALLEHQGELTGSVAPVNMPGGALFEYNSAELRADSIETLKKLGTLIARNPRSTFSIEGHTDSFGTPEYNLKLSTARAEAVKAWLVTNMQVESSKIETHGYGSTRLIVPNGTRDEQAINRRVEIVIRTPKE